MPVLPSPLISVRGVNGAPPVAGTHSRARARVQIHQRVRISLRIGKQALSGGEESVNREGGARLKLPNLWRAMDITSGEKAVRASSKGTRKSEREKGRGRTRPPRKLSVARQREEMQHSCNDLPFRIRTDPDDLTVPAVVRAVGAREARY